MTIIKKASGANSFSLKKRLKSFRYAAQGIKQAVVSQHNMWIHLGAAFLVVVFGFLLKIGFIEWMLLVFAMGFVLSAEIFNSSIEVLTDLVSPEINSRAGLVKDMAAGAVLVAAITAAIIGLLVFVPKLIAIL